MVENSCTNHIRGVEFTHTVATGLYRELMQRALRRLRPPRRSEAILFALTPDFHADTHTLQSDLSRLTHLSVTLNLGPVAALTILCSAPHSRKQFRKSRPSRSQTLLILVQMRPPLAFTLSQILRTHALIPSCSNTHFNIILYLRLVFPFRYSDHSSVQNHVPFAPALQSS